MKCKHLVLVLSIFFSSACFSSPSEKEKEREKTLDKLIASYADEGTNIQNRETKTQELIVDGTEKDYLNSDIPSDSINMLLYDLIASSSQIPTSELIRKVEMLIKKGAKPNISLTIHASVRKTGTYIPIIKHFYKNKYRNYSYISTPFHVAVGTGKIKLVEKMLELGAKANIPAGKEDYPINVATTNKDSKMIFFLLGNGANIKHVDLAPLTDVGLIEKLVNMGANPNTIDINFALGNKNNLKRLLDLHPSMQNVKLDFEKLFKDDELFDLLMDNGLPLNTRGTFPDDCPLVFGAVKYDNLKALKKLIDLGANKSTNCRKGFGETPLLRAIYYENIDAVEYLLQKGVSPNEKEWTDKSALSNAAETDNDRIINLLIDAGAKIEYNKYFGKTPIMHAVSRKKYIAVQTLIDRGANVNYKTKYGETPLIMAVKENDYPIIKLLVERGANTNIKYEGKTLAEFAKEEDASPMVVDYLESAKNQ